MLPRTMYQKKKKKKSYTDQKSEPPAQWNQEKICNLSSWSRSLCLLLLLVGFGFVCLFCFFISISQLPSCFPIFSVSSRNIHHYWNLVVRYENWKWSLSRGCVYKRRWFAVLSTPWFPWAQVSSVISLIKVTMGAWLGGVWAGLWANPPTLGAQTADGCFYFLCPLCGFLGIIFVLLVNGWFFPPQPLGLFG